MRVGYDALAPRFAEWAERVEGDPWERLVRELETRLPVGARLLDLGCGSGAKTKRLAESYEVVGVDVSAAQLRLASAEVPTATLVEADFCELDFPSESFDAVAAFYSIPHVPREKHAELFGRVARWLAPGGLFLASLGARGGEDWTGEWLGVEMFFSSHDAATNRRLLRGAAFELLLDEVVTMREPEGETAFLWVLARKPS